MDSPHFIREKSERNFDYGSWISGFDASRRISATIAVAFTAASAASS